ncbi:hypothetical protein Tco_0820259 [Tanacetum coccineum]|uniref:Xylulose kinase-1 n=1 Tax=Tanacetum coccineum TaxID=301880 RepID=A0ABQ5A8W6_9ASTR
MVAYLKKPTGSEGFQEIVDFLNGSHIRYALTKNPTIYVSFIKNFWQTATVRTVDNREQEITATVDGKEFTVTEASVRRHLQLADVDIIRVGFRVEKGTILPASLDAEQASGNINRTQSTTIPNVPLPQGIGAGGSPRCQEAIGGSIAQTRSERHAIMMGKVSTAGMVQRGFNIVFLSSVIVKDKVKVIWRYLRMNRLRELNVQQEQERLGHEAAVRLQEELDEEERSKLSKRLQAEERNKYIEVDQAKMLHMGSHTLQQLKRYSFNELNELFKTTMKNVNTFVPMETEDKGKASELVTGSSQATIIDSVEVGSSKRAAEAKLDHEGSKRQKSNEASGSVQEQPEEEEKELLQEDLQQMMMVVPVEEVYVEALQVKYPIIDWEVYTEESRKYWKIIRRYMHDPLKWRLYDTCGVHHVSTERGIDIFMLVEKEYPLSKGVLTLMLVNKLLVEQHSEMENELLRKIFIQANRPRQ